MMLLSDANGCTCDAVRVRAIEASAPVAPDWRCIACRIRGDTPAKCVHCGTGLMPAEETSQTCSVCQIKNLALDGMVLS